MRILRLHVDGFGIFHDVTSPELSPGLTLFEGPNEAGKSTLLAFLRAIPFGFEGNTNDPARYPPLRGGTHGGWMEVETRLGRRLRLQRLGDKPVKGRLTVVDLADGRQLGEEEARAILGHADRTLYREVFAFSLKELQNENEPFADKGLGTRLLASSVGAGASRILEAESRLDKELEGLYKKLGRNQRISQLIAQRQRATCELAALKERAGQYGSLREEKERLEQETEEDDRRVAHLQQRIADLEMIQKAWAPWAELETARSTLDSMEAIDQFPPDGVARLEQLKERLQERRRQLVEAQAEMGRVEGALADLFVDENLLKVQTGVDRLIRSRDVLERHLRDLPTRQGELAAQEESLRRGLADLGQGWTEEALLERDLSVAVEEQCKEHRDRLLAAEQELRTAEDERRRATRDLEDLDAVVAPSTGLSWWPAAAIALILLLAACLSWGKWIPAISLAAAAGMLIAWAVYIRGVARRTIDQAARNRDAAKMRAQSALQAAQAAEQRLTQARLAWSEWLRQHKLDERLSPDTALELTRRAQRLWEARRSVEQLRQRVRGIVRDLEDIHKDARSTFSGAGRPEPDLSGLPMAIDALGQDLQAALDTARKRQEAQARLRELGDELKCREQELRAVEHELACLLADAGAQDEDNFRKLAEVFNEGQELKRTIASKEQELATLAGGAHKRVGLEERLRATTPAAVEADLASARDELARLQEQRHKKAERLGALAQQLRELESADAESELRQRLATIEEQLRESADRWAVLTTCRLLLQRTREKWERERQPQELEVAQRYMERVTGGSYKRIYRPLGQSTITLETSGGQTLDPVRLSRGTREQLYLCLRFGHIDVYSRSERAEPLPIVMDDVLANFDPERARRTAEAILEMAQANQILFFTCHPETVAAFLQIQAVPRMQLMDGRIQPVGA
jgi:uncharacterized protein YhaN